MVGPKGWKLGGGSKISSVTSKKSASQMSSRKSASKTSASRKSASQMSSSQRSASKKADDATSSLRPRKSTTNKLDRDEPARTNPFCMDCTDLWDPYDDNEDSDYEEESDPPESAPQKPTPQKPTPQKPTPRNTVPRNTVPGKGVAGKGVPGMGVAGKAVAGKAFAGKSASEKSVSQKSVSQRSVVSSQHKTRDSQHETHAREKDVQFLQQEKVDDDVYNLCNMACTDLWSAENDTDDFYQPTSPKPVTANSHRTSDSVKEVHDRKKELPHPKVAKVEDDGNITFNKGSAKIRNPVPKDDLDDSSMLSTHSKSSAAAPLGGENRENKNRLLSVSEETVKYLEKAIDTLRKHADSKEVRNALGTLKDASERLGMSESELMTAIKEQKGRRILLAH